MLYSCHFLNKVRIPCALNFLPKVLFKNGDFFQQRSPADPYLSNFEQNITMSGWQKYMTSAWWESSSIWAFVVNLQLPLSHCSTSSGIDLEFPAFRAMLYVRCFSCDNRFLCDKYFQIKAFSIFNHQSGSKWSSIWNQLCWAFLRSAVTHSLSLPN